MAMAFPTGQELPPRAGTDGVPGSQQCLSSHRHLPGKPGFVIFPGSHEGRGLWRNRDPPWCWGLGPKGRSQAPGSLCLCPAPFGPVLRSLGPCKCRFGPSPPSGPQAPPGGLSGSCPLDPFASVLTPHFLCLGPAASSLRGRILGCEPKLCWERVLSAPQYRKDRTGETRDLGCCYREGWRERGKREGRLMRSLHVRMEAGET